MTTSMCIYAVCNVCQTYKFICFNINSGVLCKHIYVLAAVWIKPLYACTPICTPRAVCPIAHLRLNVVFIHHLPILWALSGKKRTVICQPREKSSPCYFTLMITTLHNTGIWKESACKMCVLAYLGFSLLDQYLQVSWLYLGGILEGCCWEHSLCT